jgi:hypothetical protein
MHECPSKRSAQFTFSKGALGYGRKHVAATGNGTEPRTLPNRIGAVITPGSVWRPHGSQVGQP